MLRLHYNKEDLRKMRFDMHVHTTASDGVFSPTEIVRQAEDLGLTGLAITDHDTLDGLTEAKAAIKESSVSLVFGVELNCSLGPEENAPEVHVLGYFFDPENQVLNAKLRQLQEHRRQRGQKMLTRLAELGMPLDTAILNDYAETGSVGRGMIARKLVEAGYVQDKREAFAKWLDVGKPGYVPRLHLTVPEAVQLLHGAGGLAVLAHPAQYNNDELPAQLAPFGLDGLECRHPDQPVELQPRYLQMAARLGLAVTGGSDCHTEGLGAYTMNGEEIQKLMQRWFRLK